MTVFYRKYRPQRLADLEGQETIRETLLSQLQSGKISHGYLFCGPWGTGKTSTARIFAKAVNCDVYRTSSIDNRKKPIVEKRSTINVYGEPCNKCESCKSITNGSSLDLIEIDAASNRGIDDVRELREKVKLAPIYARFKVYIIDEAHMLTTEAFNALLKTLEEPPEHAIFILATTDANKLPPTIISRLVRFNFKKAGGKSIVDTLAKIAKAEELKVDEEAILEIAKIANGSFRDAVSILDQLSSHKGKISTADVQAVSKVPQAKQLQKLVSALSHKDLKTSVEIVTSLAQDTDAAAFSRELMLFLEVILLYKIGIGSEEEIVEYAQQFEFNDLQTLMKLLLVAEGEIKQYPLAQIPLVLAICKYCEDQNTQSISESVSQKVSGPVGQKIRAVDTPGVNRDGAKHTPGVSKVKGKKSNLTMEDIKEHWGEFVSRVRPINAHVVALLRSTRPVAIRGDTLYLEVFFRFHKEKLEEQKIKNLLETTMSEILGNEIFFKLTLANEDSRPTKVVAASDVVEASGDDLSKIAAEIFSK